MLKKTVSLIALVALLGAVAMFSAQPSSADTITVFGQTIDAETNATFCLVDDFGYFWTLTYDGTRVGSTAMLYGDVLAPPPSCYKDAYDMHNLATGRFSLTAYAGCGVEAFTYTGQWNEATNSGTAVWTNSDGGSGTINVSRATFCDSLDGSITPAIDGPMPNGPMPNGPMPKGK